MRPFDYHEPATLHDALELLQRHAGDVMPMAGGTAMALLLGQGLVQPGNVVGLRRIPELHGIRALEGGGLELGALVTHAEAERSDLVAGYCPALARAYAEVATVRIRNQATVGGSLAHADPAQDPPPMLLALDAEAVVEGPAGGRRLPLHELFVDYMETSLAPDELITAIALPPAPAPAGAVFHKFLPRTRDDYATVAVAAVVERGAGGRCARARIALGGAGPVPVRAWRAEGLLHGGTLGEESIAAAAVAVAEDIDPIADSRGSAEYKREMARVWTERALRRCLDRDTPWTTRPVDNPLAPLDRTIHPPFDPSSCRVEATCGSGGRVDHPGRGTQSERGPVDNWVAPLDRTDDPPHPGRGTRDAGGDG